MPSLASLLTPEEIRLLALAPTLPVPLEQFKATQIANLASARALLLAYLEPIFGSCGGISPRGVYGPSSISPGFPAVESSAYQLWISCLTNKFLLNPEGQARITDPSALSQMFPDLDLSRGMPRQPVDSAWLAIELEKLRASKVKLPGSMGAGFSIGGRSAGILLDERRYGRSRKRDAELEIREKENRQSGQQQSRAKLPKPRPGRNPLEAFTQPQASPQAPRRPRTPQNPLTPSGPRLEPRQGRQRLQLGDLVQTPRGRVGRITRIDGRYFYVGGLDSSYYEADLQRVDE